MILYKLVQFSLSVMLILAVFILTTPVMAQDPQSTQKASPDACSNDYDRYTNMATGTSDKGGKQALKGEGQNAQCNPGFPAEIKIAVGIFAAILFITLPMFMVIKSKNRVR